MDSMHEQMYVSRNVSGPQCLREQDAVLWESELGEANWFGFIEITG
ncbi:MAG: hypothetical protein JO151_03815 [Verrucomicrobia bacterium]|jgi:hypothetical protein|nr:hypothetical protein [Verrucomicrobiota bacterium]